VLVLCRDCDVLKQAQVNWNCSSGLSVKWKYIFSKEAQILSRVVNFFDQQIGLKSSCYLRLPHIETAMLSDVEGLQQIKTCKNYI
jgi:hypothetical protein